MKYKIKEWIKRYLPSEIAGTITALAVAQVCHLFYKNSILSAYSATVGEAIGFYSAMFVQSLLLERKNKSLEKVGISLRNTFKIIKNILIEFGPAALLDGLIFRPFFMYSFPLLLNNFSLGILVGKITGDVLFYLIVIITFEVSKTK